MESIHATAIKLLGLFTGGILSLTFTGDIDKNGKLDINISVLLKFALSLITGAYVGHSILFWTDWHSDTGFLEGFVLLISATLALTVIGIFTHAIAMLKGKSLKEITEEISQAFKNIFQRK